MLSKTILLSVHDDSVDWSDKTKEAQEPLNTFGEQQLAFGSHQQERAVRFKGADNPYAAALADVFGLEA